MLYERWACATIFEDDVRVVPTFGSPELHP